MITKYILFFLAEIEASFWHVCISILGTFWIDPPISNSEIRYCKRCTDIDVGHGQKVYHKNLMLEYSVAHKHLIASIHSFVRKMSLKEGIALRWCLQRLYAKNPLDSWKETAKVFKLSNKHCFLAMSSKWLRQYVIINVQTVHDFYMAKADICLNSSMCFGSEIIYEATIENEA